MVELPVHCMAWLSALYGGTASALHGMALCFLWSNCQCTAWCGSLLFMVELPVHCMVWLSALYAGNSQSHCIVWLSDFWWLDHRQSHCIRDSLSAIPGQNCQRTAWSGSPSLSHACELPVHCTGMALCFLWWNCQCTAWYGSRSSSWWNCQCTAWYGSSAFYGGTASALHGTFLCFLWWNSTVRLRGMDLCFLWSGTGSAFHKYGSHALLMVELTSALQWYGSQLFMVELPVHCMELRSTAFYGRTARCTAWSGSLTFYGENCEIALHGRGFLTFYRWNCNSHCMQWLAGLQGATSSRKGWSMSSLPFMAELPVHCMAWLSAF